MHKVTYMARHIFVLQDEENLGLYNNCFNGKIHIPMELVSHGVAYLYCIGCADPASATDRK